MIQILLLAALTFLAPSSWSASIEQEEIRQATECLSKLRALKDVPDLKPLIAYADAQIAHYSKPFDPATSDRSYYADEKDKEKMRSLTFPKIVSKVFEGFAQEREKRDDWGRDWLTKSNNPKMVQFKQVVLDPNCRSLVDAETGSSQWFFIRLKDQPLTPASVRANSRDSGAVTVAK